MTAQKEILPMNPNPDSALLETPSNIGSACRLVAEHFGGERGRWLYRAFDWINHHLFFGELPDTLLLFGLTAHGHCLGQTHLCLAPTILVHPSLWGGTEKANPWGVAPDLLVPRYVFDTVIHECTHVSAKYRLGGSSKHKSPEWIAEVNRLAPLLGFKGVVAGPNRPVRVGKSVHRRQQGNVPFNPAVCGFPRGLRMALGQIDYYRDRSPLSFE